MKDQSEICSYYLIKENSLPFSKHDIENIH